MRRGSRSHRRGGDTGPSTAARITAKARASRPQTRESLRLAQAIGVGARGKQSPGLRAAGTLQAATFVNDGREVIVVLDRDPLEARSCPCHSLLSANHGPAAPVAASGFGTTHRSLEPKAMHARAAVVRLAATASGMRGAGLTSGATTGGTLRDRTRPPWARVA